MPGEIKPLLFISSTSDLLAERMAIDEVAGKHFEVYRYEEDSARKQAPRDRLEKILASSDVFVGVLGANYGSVYPDCESDPSIVEWEFDTARNQSGTEVLAFRKAITGRETDPRQQRFLDGLTHFVDGLWLKNFSSIDELKSEVGNAIMTWFMQFWHASLEERNRRPRSTVAGIFLTVCICVTGGAAAATFLGKLPVSDALSVTVIASLTALGALLVANR